MPSNHRLHLKQLDYPHSNESHSTNNNTNKAGNKNNQTISRYIDNNRQLVFLPQLMVLLVVAGVIAGLVWIYAPTPESDNTIPTTPQLALEPTNQSSSLATNNTSTTSPTNKPKSSNPQPISTSDPSQTAVFNPTTAYAQKQIEDATYFLDGGCQAPRTRSCDLWKVDSFSGKSTLLQRNVAQTEAGQVNELKPSHVLRFAQTQAYPESISFILFTPDTGKTQLIVIETTSGNYQITQTREVIPGSEEYMSLI